MRILGIDYGDTIGLAISDPDRAFAFPLEVIPANGTEVEYVAKICAERGITTVVIGDTLALNGHENRITGRSDAFAAAVAKKTGLPVHREREAWSTVEAARFAPKGDKHNDASAAAIILQRYLSRA